MPHHHGCDSPHPVNEVLRYIQLGCISIAIGVVQVIGSQFSGSISLLSDTIHVASDGLGFFISAYVAWKVIKLKLYPYDEIHLRTFWMRVNGLILLPSLGWILYEAWERFQHPSHVIGTTVMIAAALGACGNVWQHQRMPHTHTVTAKMQMLHVQSDLYSSLAVIAGGLTIWAFGLTIIDPILSVIIALWILRQTVQMIWHGKSAHEHAHHH